MPEDHAHSPAAPLIDQQEPPRPRTVRARHAASLIVYRMRADGPEMLMGLRGAKHRFMPNRLVFPGGAVDRADLSAPAAVPLTPHTERMLRKKANAHLTHGLGIAAAREPAEETRAVTPPGLPIRFNARFLVVDAERATGTLGGDGELDALRYYGLGEALALDLALPTRRVLERLQIWLSMSVEERMAQTHAPVLLRDRGWRME
ncbi:MAG: NUDIX hydrolase [Rhodospirillales bacterium]|nr:NUDIX hydrolase [Rhodospirillales bacterium]